MRSGRGILAVAAAVVVALVVSAPSPGGQTGRVAATAPGCDALVFVNSTIDKTHDVDADKWTTITDTNAVWDTEGWRGEYNWTIPRSIPKTGADAVLNVTATDKSGASIFLQVSATSTLNIEGGPTAARAQADKSAGRPTASGSASFKLIPGCYS